MRAAVRQEIAAERRVLGARTPPASALPPAFLAALPAAAGAFDAAWEALGEAERRELANAVLRTIVVRITPRPAPQEFLREVVGVDYQDWVPGLGGEAV